MSAYLDISKLSKSFSGRSGEHVVVQDFDLKIQKGEFVCLIGHSGCGKSTVLSIAAGLSEATTGGIILAGRELDGPGTDRGIVFQAPCLLPWLTALENVLLAVDQVHPKSPAAERKRIAAEQLDIVGLGGALHKRPAELSQGMRQRVGIARAFSLSPKLLLLDEPFGMLDSITRFELQGVLAELWRKDQKTALMVTHDVDEALYLADRIVMMTNGPAAGIGGILSVPFPRPRNRDGLLEDPDYYVLREHLIGFLEDQAHPEVSAADPCNSNLELRNSGKERTRPGAPGADLHGFPPRPPIEGRLQKETAPLADGEAWVEAAGRMD
jgi:nitrate/nitrite transport system ATP-binding protein